MKKLRTEIKPPQIRLTNKKDQEVHTLLQEFINFKLREYKEPQREGTVKGDPIGLSVRKYHVTLLMLYGLKLKKIASDIGVSYGLLRKWTTEEDFKRTIGDHHTDFTSSIIKYIEDSEADLERADVKYKAKSLKEIARTPPPSFKLKMLTDFTQWSESLKICALRRMSSEYSKTRQSLAGKTIIDIRTPKEIKAWGRFLAFSFSFLYLDALKKSSPGRAGVDIEDGLNRMYVSNFVDVMKGFVLKPCPSLQDKKTIMALIWRLEDIFKKVEA